MLEKKEIIERLKKEGFSEIDEIKYKKDMLVLNFFYEFDDTELDGAKEYANENYDESKGESDWYDVYFLPYLTDIASDNVREIVEEICEDMDIQGEFVAYEMDKNSYEQCEFTIVFADEDKDFDIDEILEELEI
ncbi:hypothetical protein Q428_08460 [Fervidicella metallireducens AeB]|uniref:Uncharacterized protein n=1 Tax=Fervidicella metallireducens AeB TaxID=1403537 RepID=A0A017RWL1_9CLOT|nr:hypothetical protein [Fervidicella metallireducens]EYE88330.1 hypothetical protein Q428_08460 [Fervidicella metallireducens AeB]